MGYSREPSGCETIGCLVNLIIGLILPLTMFFFEHSLYKNVNFLYSIIALLVIISIYVNFKNNKLHKKCTDLQSDMRQLEIQTERKISQTTKEFKEKEAVLLRQINACHEFAECSFPFTLSASLQADMKTVIFEEARKELTYKKRPARKAAEVVKELKERAYKAIDEYKSMTYKVEFLLQTFPEIKRYFDEDEALISLSTVNSYDSFVEERDRTRDYLSDEEWKRLTIDQRNQLALDRWKQSPKSNWMIGMLYEMYIGHLLRPQNFNVIQFGIINGLNDLGRDIIAKRHDPDGIERIYIIQCKNWSQKKEIHENVVCQLFGTAMEYQINHKCTEKQKVIPVLYVTTKLSPTAQEFAKRLGVVVKVEPLGDFPMIKCNINNDSKIYHLPFDQQYWNTKIENPGEFYAMTVAEAVKRGFRRAFKHKLNS